MARASLPVHSLPLAEKPSRVGSGPRVSRRFRSKSDAAFVSGAGECGGAFAVHRRVMNPSRVTGDLLAGMWRLLSQCVDVIPRTLLWDNESGICQCGRLAEDQWAALPGEWPESA